MPQGVGERLKIARERAGLTQDQAGKATNRDGSSVNRYESEEREAPSDFLEMVCHHWRVDVEGRRVFDPGVYGVSINYVLNMPSSTESLTAEEMDLIYLYREVPPSAQAARIPNEEIE